jgi:hypothetical protein
MTRADQDHGRVDDQSERRAARDVERQVGADIDPGQAHDGNGSQGKDPATWPEPGEDGGAQDDGHAGVPGQVSEPGGVGAAAAGPSKQARGPGPLHPPRDHRRPRPRAPAPRPEPAP